MSIDTWREMPQSLEYGAQDDELAALRTRLRDTAAVLAECDKAMDQYFTVGGINDGGGRFSELTGDARAILKRLKEDGLI